MSAQSGMTLPEEFVFNTQKAEGWSFGLMMWQ